MSYTILTDNDEKITQPKSIKIELLNHQKTMIHKMLCIEETGTIKINDCVVKSFNIFDIPGNQAELKTNIAILGDKVGSGKTLMIISLITIKKQIPDRLIELGGSQYYSIKLKPSSPLLKTNLIIVPHKILSQWSESFEKYSPNLNIYSIDENKKIDDMVKIIKIKRKDPNGFEYIEENEKLIENKIYNYDVIIISENLYRRFYKICQNYRFDRIFIDEADSIKLPKDMNCQFNFMWLITGTPTGLFNFSKPFINKIFKNENLSPYFVIKNDDIYIDNSIKLPHPKIFKIKCITPRELDIIKDLIPSSVLQMINAGNICEAIKALNCNIDTDENILQVITKNILETIENKKIQLEAEEKKHYPINQEKMRENKINMIKVQIDILYDKYENIKKRVYQLNDTNCPICLCGFEFDNNDESNRVIVSCCNNTFCADCLIVSLAEIKNNKCPYCQQRISTKDIHMIKSNSNTNNRNINSNKYIQKNKLDVLVDLVKNKPDKSFLIFAGFIETFHKIETQLKDLDISYNILKGDSETVKNYIDDFKNKKIQILMLNAQHFGAGMNLHMATDIIMYHRFNNETEEQIIGRAQRLGRNIEEPLNVYYLLHDNESDNINDNFNFEDMSNIHYLDWLETEQK